MVEELTASDIIEARSLDWFETCAAIRSDDGSIIRAPEQLRANELQEQINEAIEWCELTRKPCRLMVLKPRKEGSTTFLVGKSYHLCRSSQAHLLQIGDEYQTTQTMWTMLRTFAENDQHEWANKQKRFTADAKTGNAEWSHNASAWCDTAGDSRAGQSKTPTIIHAEEVAHWRSDGSAASAADTMLALLNSIRDIPGTYVFVSSTANGQGNWYWRTYQGAVSLAERKKGNEGNGWIKVFLPWHRSKWSVRDVPSGGLHDLTERERSGQAVFGWTPEQIAWRRHTIANKCDGDESKFDQEYPQDEISAFVVKAGEARFNQEGVQHLLKEARLFALVAERHTREHPELSCYGELTDNAGNVAWLPSSFEEGWVWCAEKPRPGCSYIAFGDPMTGEQSAGSKKRDTHGCGILREAYTDAEQVFHQREVVAVLHAPDGCRWDNDILNERLRLLQRFYGDPVAIIEANNAGVEVLRLLRLSGARLWRRLKRDHKNPGKKMDVVGFQTTSTTKNLWIGAVGSHIREQTLGCKYLPACEQFASFILTEDGRGQATDGALDDMVTGIGLGLFAIGSATPYYVAGTTRPESTMYAGVHVTEGYAQRESRLGGALS